jgi:hypothetical protein
LATPNFCKVALICLFLAGDFDMLIAVRTAPHHSWCNPAERIMSVINYGLQGVAIEREKMAEEFEGEFETLKTLEDIREGSKNNPNLKVELEKCITTVQELLCDRTEHLTWKNEPFQTEVPASNLEINEMFEVIFLLQIIKISAYFNIYNNLFVNFSRIYCELILH